MPASQRPDLIAGSRDRDDVERGQPRAYEPGLRVEMRDAEIGIDDPDPRARDRDVLTRGIGQLAADAPQRDRVADRVRRVVELRDAGGDGADELRGGEAASVADPQAVGGRGEIGG